MDDRKRDDYKVGYRRPPKDTQFKKGKSGNPAGRPKGKGKQEAKSLLAPHPTRSILLEEAQRMLSIREGEQRSEITTTKAVVRSLAKQALEGGILATRTFIELVLAEDERVAGEREATFQFWKGYVVRENERLDLAKKRGVVRPEPVPHPDDIQFDHFERTVLFSGPADEKEAMATRSNRELSHLFYELSRFHEEEIRVDHETGGLRAGLWFALFLYLQQSLPKRLRGLPAKFDGLAHEIVVLRRHHWKERLERRCAELGFPREIVAMRPATVSTTDIGIKALREHVFVSIALIIEKSRKPARYRMRHQAA